MGREVSPFMLGDIRDELQGYTQSILERSLGLGGTSYDVLARLNSEFPDIGHELAANGSQWFQSTWHVREENGEVFLIAESKTVLGEYPSIHVMTSVSKSKLGSSTLTTIH